MSDTVPATNRKDALDIDVTPAEIGRLITQNGDCPDETEDISRDIYQTVQTGSSKEESSFNLESSSDLDGDAIETEKSASALVRLRRRARKSCTTKLLKRRLPFLLWAPQYNIHSALCDMIAGITVALTAIPQGIAYGAVAGLPVEYGLYTAFAGPFVYALFGSVSQITVGPTAVMALMTLEYTSKGGAPYAIILSFLAGCAELIAGLLNLGFLMEFISGPVISGFCSAAAVTVITAQFKTIFGLTFRGSTFAKVFPGIMSSWQDIKLWDTVLGFSFIVFLLLLKNLTLLKKMFSNTCCLHNRRVDQTLWFISTCRNAIAVLLGCLIAYVFEIYGVKPFNLTGEIKSGIPSFQLPPFSVERLVEPMIGFNVSSNWTDIIANQTYEVVAFDTVIKDLGIGLVLVPVIAILEQVAIAKAFSAGGRTDSTQEMIALGLGSIFCSFFGSFPLTASFSRSSVMSASGAKTQFANFFNGGVILLALSFLMPTFSYIPKSVLGAVIIVAVYTMIEYEELVPMWKGRRVELIPFGATFFCCLLINMEYGILIGAQSHLMLLAYEASRSKTTCLRLDGGDALCEKIVLRADRNLYFPSVERFRNSLTKAAYFHSSPRTIVIDMNRVTQIDYTSLKMLKSMLAVWEKRGEKCVFTNVSKRVKESLQSVVSANLRITSPSTAAVHTKVSFDDGVQSMTPTIKIE